MTRDPAAVKSAAAERLRAVGGGSPAPLPTAEAAAGAGAADDCEALWALCLDIARRRRHGLPAVDLVAPGGRPDTEPRIDWHPARGWLLAGDWSTAAREMFDLYRPLLALQPGQRYVLGHLGQSIDGRIATSSGDSCFINGKQNLVHMHRLRALCDAVVVGATTVLSDDPQLTTRMVPGCHATRVVIDPSQRLTPEHRVCSDGRCPTLVARFPSLDDDARPRCGQAELIPAVASGTGVDLRALLDTLSKRGLHAVLVEGGGITVSRFLRAGVVDRLHVTVAPLIIGSGRPALALEPIDTLDQALRPRCRHFHLGEDILFDLELH